MLAGAVADIGVQFGERLHALAQGRDLADHVHAVAALTVLGHDDDCAIGAAIETLGRDAQAAEIEVFEGVADILGAAVLAQQAPPLVVERARERGIDTA